MADDRLTGYATENVVPITALEQDTIDALWDELRKSLHAHDGYDWRSCSVCRRLEAERVSHRFPDGYRATGYHPDTTVL